MTNRTTVTAGLGLVCVLAGALAAAGPVRAQSRFLHQPTLHGQTVAFVSEGEIWTAPLAGGQATRLTGDGLPKSAPRFSPDGRAIAYSAQGAGGKDAYVVRLADGAVSRITWHPADDSVEGWTPDGTGLLLASKRTSPHKQAQLFTVPAGGGHPTPFPMAKAYRGALSPGGDVLAYTPTSDVFATWKRYRGGQIARIWLTKLGDFSHVPVQSPGSNDTNPIWVGGRLHFLSDRTGSFGIHRANADGSVAPVLTGPDFDIDWLGGADTTLVFANQGYLWRLDLPSGTPRRLDIRLPNRPRLRSTADVAGSVAALALAPDGQTLAAEARGEIFLKRPGEAAVNLTRTSGVAERAPVWSPDGGSIAYVSDAGGAYGIHVRRVGRRAAARRLGNIGTGFPQLLSWAPDGRSIAYLAHDRSIALLDLGTGRHSRLGGNVLNGSRPIWSPDGSSLFFVERRPSGYGQARRLDVATGTATDLTDGLAHVAEILLSKDGGTLFLLASLDAGPGVTDMESSGMLLGSSISAAVYRLDLGAGGRLARLPGTVGRYRSAVQIERNPASATLLAGPDGTVVAVQEAGPPRPYHQWYGEDGAAVASQAVRRFGPEGGAVAARASPGMTDEPAADTVLADGAVQPSASPTALLYQLEGKPVIATIGDRGRVAIRRIDLGPLTMEIDHRAEHLQIFDETVRRFEGYFHDPRLHDVDWAAAARRYRPWVADVRVRSDLDFVLRHLVGEVGNSHIDVEGPKDGAGADLAVAGLLGADFKAVGGRLQVAHVLKASPWESLPSPLADAGVEAGDTLLAIDGQDITAADDPDRLLAGRAGKPVRLTVRPRAGGPARTVEVSPLASDTTLRQRDWIERQRRHVEARSGGRIAYIHQPNTSAAGLADFTRYFFAQSDRQAVIIDERFNNGGLDPDYQYDVLARRRLYWYQARGLPPFQAPKGMIDGPRVMLVNAEAGSGGDLYPHGFKAMGLGHTIGTTTWGGVHGTLRDGLPDTLIDGGTVRVPDLATFGPDGIPILENRGFVPDEIVDIAPADDAAGRDPQLDRAVDHLLDALTRGPQTGAPPPLTAKGRP